MDDVRDIQLDIFNIPLNNLAKRIVKLGAASTETIEVLKNWDGRMTPDSRGAVLANEIRGCLANAIADDNRPATATAIRERVLDRAISQQSALWLPKKYQSYKDFITACDSNVRASLSDTKRLGPDPAGWIWVKISVARFPHPLTAVPLIGQQFAVPQVPIAGSGQTPNVGSAVSMRFIASPGNWDATRHVIPLGESGDPKSPFFTDQFSAWQMGTAQIFPFSKEAVGNAATMVTLLSPK
jgi:penicillin amidase